MSFQAKEKSGKCDCCSCCGSKIAEVNTNPEESIHVSLESEAISMEIKVMGPGCKKCHQLYENTLEAVSDLGGNINVVYVDDIAELAASGIMSTPALIIDGKIASSGKVLKTAEAKKLIEKHQ